MPEADRVADLVGDGRGEADIRDLDDVVEDDVGLDELAGDRLVRAAAREQGLPGAERDRGALPLHDVAAVVEADLVARVVQAPGRAGGAIAAVAHADGGAQPVPRARAVRDEVAELLGADRGAATGLERAELDGVLGRDPCRGGRTALRRRQARRLRAVGEERDHQRYGDGVDLERQRRADLAPDRARVVCSVAVLRGGRGRVQDPRATRRARARSVPSPGARSRGHGWRVRSGSAPRNGATGPLAARSL